MKIWKTLLLVILVIACVVALLVWLASINNSMPSESQQTDACDIVFDAKPVIYLYPEEPMEISVKLHYAGKLTCTWPDYYDGWTVFAQPDGTLTDAAGNEYAYLFWEGVNQTSYDMSRGFVVPGAQTGEFLRSALSRLGLNPEEYNEFIVYWLPKMQDNPYNLITFQQEAYTDAAKLEITPEPDSILRVFMVYQALEEPVDIPEQTLEPFDREGFTVVEWGGTELRQGSEG